MKTIKTTILLIALTLSLTSNATNPKNKLKSIQKEIQNKLSVNTTNSEKVNVSFSTDETGKVNLAIADTKNQLLKQNIENSFLKLYIRNTLPNDVYSVTLNLKIQ